MGKAARIVSVLPKTIETDGAALVECIHCNGSGRDPVGADGYEPDEGPCYLCSGVGKISQSQKAETIRLAEECKGSGLVYSH